MRLAGSPGGGEFAPGGGGGDGGGSEKPSGGKGGKAKVSKISDFTTPTSRFSEQWI